MLTAFIVAAAILIALLLWESFSERRDLKRYPAPGRFVPDTRLHVLEQGTGPSTVVLESGLAASSISWLHVQERVSNFARVVSYDRAGLGWSGANQKPLNLDVLLANLATVLKAKQSNRKTVLVGHSFGALIVSAFAHRHPENVSGLVLVDPVSFVTYANPNLSDAARLSRAIRLCRRGAWLARVAIVRGALALVTNGRYRIASFIGSLSAGQGSSVMNRLATEIAKLPPQTYGPIRSQWSRPASFRVLAEYLRALPALTRQAQAMPIPVEIPIIVLSAASATETEQQERDKLVRYRSASRHTIVPNTTHWIQLDRPDLVAEAIEELIIK